MSALGIAAIVLACVFAGALLGMVLRGVLPARHLGDESKDVVRLGTGLVATMAALVLGLLVASAKGSYDTQKDGLDKIAADIILLDTVLHQYGPPAEDVRAHLRRTVAVAIARLWPQDAAQEPTLGAPETWMRGPNHASVPSVRSTGSHAACESAVPPCPGVAPISATGLPANTRAMSAGGRESQSITFFTTPGIELLYSGVTISNPSLPAIASLSTRTGSGIPCSTSTSPS